LVAPLALVCAIGATGAVVVSSRAGDRTTVSTAPKHERSAAPRHSTYVVRNGDTLSSIALRVGVPVNDLQNLNPETDSLSLQPGQRLRLRTSS